MQSAADNLTVNQLSPAESTAPSAVSSQQGGAATGAPVQALDLLLGNNFDLYQLGLQRAKAHPRHHLYPG